jgi:hypothetical protein
MRVVDHKGSRFNIFLGREGISSRGHIGQGGNKEEVTTGKRRIIQIFM